MRTAQRSPPWIAKWPLAEVQDSCRQLTVPAPCHPSTTARQLHTRYTLPVRPAPLHGSGHVALVLALHQMAPMPVVPILIVLPAADAQSLFRFRATS